MLRTARTTTILTIRTNRTIATTDATARTIAPTSARAHIDRAGAVAQPQPPPPPITGGSGRDSGGGFALHTALSQIMPGDVARWINGRAKLAGVNLRPDALDALATALAADTERIENELAKLASWANGQAVTGDDVRALVSGAIESDVFELTKAVVRRDVRTAAPLLERLLAEGNAPQQLLALLLWQFRVLLFASRDPKPAEAAKMAAAIRSSPGAILRYTQYARGLAPSDIARAYESLYACDVSIKTGRADSDEAALLLCVMDLCGVHGADYRDFLLREAPRR